MSGSPAVPGGPHELTREDAAYVARLARLALLPEELDLFAFQLAAVLEHAARVSGLDLEGVPPAAHALPLANVMRADVPRASLPRDEVMAQAPFAEDGRFRVPPILGEAP